MKILVWQQFSSNNSSSYVIVGAFETVKQADDAAIAFRKLLRRIWESYVANPAMQDAVLKEEGHERTEVENAVMHDYDIEFEQALDWVARQETLDFLPDAVAAFERFLFVATTDETVSNDTPLAQFMHNLGADVKFEEAMDAYLMVSITAQAPDPSTATFIKTTAERYFTRDTNVPWQHPPWVLFYDGKLATDLEQLSRDVDTFIANYYAWREWHAVHKDQVNDLTTRREAASKAKDDQAAKVLTEQISALLSKQHDVEPRLPDNVYRHVHKIMCWTSVEAEDDNKIVSIDGNTVKFPGLHFLPDDLGHGLPAIVTWLRALGCVNVSFEFLPLRYQRQG